MMHFVFLGCGPSNLFSVLYLIKNGFDGSQITIIDKGKDPFQRTEKDLLFGLGGAGFWSDGKYIFANYYDVVNEEDKLKYFNFIKNVLIEFIPKENINYSLPINFDVKNTTLKLKEAECWHVGSSNNIILGQNIYNFLLEKGVHFEWGKTITDIYFSKKQVRANKYFYNYDYLQIGLGKTSTNFIKELCNTINIKLNSGSVHIGGRFECEYNEKIKWFTENVQYDFKFYKKYPRNIELRTFCVNNKSAYVVKEKEIDYEGEKTRFNGHSFGTEDKINNLTNFGIIAEIKTKDSYHLQYKLLREIYHNGLYNNGIFYLKDFPKFKPSLNLQKLNSTVYLPFSDKEFNEDFADFILEICKFFEIKSYLIYFPEIKLSPGIIDVDENFNLKNGTFKEVSWVGDGCVGTRGIVPASLTGLKAVEKFLK